ncbi:HAD family hydrolase [Cobetia sp. MB87]|uniref:HAD-IA family hydrolase n=1 Tax=Cobetia sp. MB87 TaxID=2588451 RepID=UPI00140C7146|nr:5-amino-6-(5-phospho-D-ribitylamino)uracil phosphatase YigB [Cobetia sp. MB87]
MTPANAPRLTALTFDLDDTLWANRAVMERAEAEHYAWLDGEIGHANDFPLEEYTRRRMALGLEHPLRRGDFTWLRREAMHAMLRDAGHDDEQAGHWSRAAIERFLALRHELTPFPEASELLDSLARNYRLGAITNGNVDLARLALDHHFEFSIAAGEWLAPKPDARPFLAAMARLGSRPSTTLHVGDSWKEDALPAARLGMQAAWIDVKGQGAPGPVPAGVHVISHVRELPALIARLND